MYFYIDLNFSCIEKGSWLPPGAFLHTCAYALLDISTYVKILFTYNKTVLTYNKIILTTIILEILVHRTSSR